MLTLIIRFAKLDEKVIQVSIHCNKVTHNLLMRHNTSVIGDANLKVCSLNICTIRKPFSRKPTVCLPLDVLLVGSHMVGEGGRGEGSGVPSVHVAGNGEGGEKV